MPPRKSPATDTGKTAATTRKKRRKRRSTTAKLGRKPKSNDRLSRLEQVLDRLGL